MNVFIKYTQKTYFLPLLFVLTFAFFLRWTVLVKYGVNLNINSDDFGYQASALRFLETGMLTYHDPDKPTVHIMPGQPLLLASIFYIFGYNTVGLLISKLTMIAFGLSSVYYTFKIGQYIANAAAGLVAAFLLAIYIPQIVVDNLTLTESPFLCFSLGLLYYSLRISDSRSYTDLAFILLFYVLALYFRVQIALYPLLLFIFLMIKRYPIAVMWRQAAISFIVLLIALGPWWVRNYVHFHEFIPLTSGSGNPLLLGTFQGEGYPPGKEVNQVYKDIHEQYPDIEAHKWMEMEKNIAAERMKLWWDTDKISMLRSYLILKPQIFWKDPFYWIPIFNILIDKMTIWFNFLKLAFFTCLIPAFLLLPKRRHELLFLIGIILFNTYFNSIYFAYNRYALPLMPLGFVVIGAGLSIVALKLREGTAVIAEKYKPTSKI